MNGLRILPALAIVSVLGSSAGTAIAGTGKDGEEISTALSARVSATEAITAAERRTGGKAARIDLEKDNGAYRYEVKTLSGGKFTEVIVDPMSGDAMSTDSEGFLGRLFEDDDSEDYGTLPTSPTTLAMAVSKAEKKTGGKTIEARFDGDEGNNRFKVEVAKDNTVLKVIVDAVNGTVTGVTTGDDGEHDEE